MIDEDDERELVKALFEQLVEAPLKRLSRGCRGVPNEDGAYVIYGREARATGILCPVDLGTGYKRLSDTDADAESLP